MSDSRDIEYKKYLETTLRRVTEKLQELEAREQVDELAEQKAAFAKGRRVAWRTKGGAWYTTNTPTWMEGFEYKVVPDDAVCTETFYLPEFGDMIKLEFTRYGLDGKTVVKVIE